MKTSMRSLTCCFLIIIFVIAFANVSLLTNAINENAQGSLADIKNAIQGAYVSDELWNKNNFLNLHGLYTRVSGKRVTNETVLLKNGMLGTTHFTDADAEKHANGIERFSEWLSTENVSFMYVQMPYKLDIKNTLLPTGVEIPANSTVNKLLNFLQEKNIHTLDLRKELSATPEMVQENFYRTDHHWTPVAALRGAQLTLQALQEYFPKEYSMGSDVLNADQWTVHKKANQFLGYYGKRVGKYFAGVDDLIWLTPNFETRMSMYIPKYRNFVSGAFDNVVLQKEYIEDEASHFELNHYCVYIGGEYPLVQHRNELASIHKKILIIKDSFTLPYQSFLSTVFSQVDVIDPRHYTEHTLAQYIKATKPDLVMLAINPSVLGWPQYFNYPLPSEHVGDEKMVHQENISFAAAEGKYTFKEIDYALKPGVCYRVTMDEIEVREGNTDGVFLAVYDASTKKFYDTTVLDLKYCQVVGKYDWSFCAPEDDAAHTKLLVYSGKHGATNGVAVSYENLVLIECD